MGREMTRIHFDAIAEIVNNSKEYLNDKQRRLLCMDLIDYLQHTNVLFDNKLFIHKCGIYVEENKQEGGLDGKNDESGKDSGIEKED